MNQKQVILMMHRLLINSLLCLLTVLASLEGFAQVNSDDQLYQLFVKGQAYQDSVVLRWVPGNYFSWQLANYHGVIVERKGSNETEWNLLHDIPLFPLKLEEWKAQADTTNVYVATAAQMLYGKAALEIEDATSMSRKLTVAREQQNRVGLAAVSAEFSKQAANGLAWRFVDKKVDDNKIYTYRVRIAAETKVLPGIDIVSTSKIYKAVPVRQVKTENGDGTITVSWSIKENNSKFSGYEVYFSKDGGKTFNKINNVVIGAIAGNDTIQYQEFAHKVTGYDTDYDFKVRGITSFADKGLFSKIVSGRSIDLKPPAPPAIFKAKAIDEESVAITWEEAEAQPEDHVGYNIYRATTYKGNYELVNNGILKSKTRSFTDKNPIKHKTNFYQIEAVDKDGNSSRGFPHMVVLPDSNPPAKPTELIGNVDTLGVVSLAWPFGEEKDLMGYRIFRATAKNREFVQITNEPIPINFYRDTIPINTLSEKIYYTISAFDFNYNPSPFSDTLELKKPDIVPPAAPRFDDYLITADSVLLSWIQSPNQDVIKNRLYRKRDTSEWELIVELPTDISYYSDKQVKIGSVYQYTLKAVDDVGWESVRSFPLTAHINDNGLRKGKPALRGEFSKESKSFVLTWDLPVGVSTDKTLIYKGTSLESLKIIKSIEGSKTSFADMQFYNNEQGYFYAVKGLMKDGSETVFSNYVKASFK